MSDTAILGYVITLIIALLAAIPATMTAYAALQQGKRNAERNEEIVRKTDQNTALTVAVKEETKALVEKAVVQAEKTEEIHTLTDGNMTIVRGELAALKSELATALQQNINLQSLVSLLVEKDARVTSTVKNTAAQKVDAAVNELIVPTIIEDATRKLDDAAQKVDDAVQKVDELGSMADTVGDTHRRVKKIEKEIVKEKE